jgi:hypothetical protein
MMWTNPATGSWLELVEELPQKVRQMISDRESIITIFFNPHSFAIVDAVAKGVAFNAWYFIDHVIIPLHQRYLKASTDLARRKLRRHFDNSRCHTAAVVTQEMQLIPPILRSVTSTCSSR